MRNGKEERGKVKRGYSIAVDGFGEGGLSATRRPTARQRLYSIGSSRSAGQGGGNRRSSYSGQLDRVAQVCVWHHGMSEINQARCQSGPRVGRFRYSMISFRPILSSGCPGSPSYRDRLSVLSRLLQGLRKGVDIRSLLAPKSSRLLLTCMFSRIIQLTTVRPSVIESAFDHQGRDLAGCSSLGFTGDLRMYKCYFHCLTIQQNGHGPNYCTVTFYTRRNRMRHDTTI